VTCFRVAGEQSVPVVFPNPEALLRLAGAVLVEAHDEWQTTDRRYLAEATLLTAPPPQEEVATPELMTA
jgi:putative transposase